MKKNYLTLGLFLLGLFLITGCGGKDPFQEAQKKLELLDNYKLTTTITVGAKSQGISVEIPITVDQKIDQKNQIIKLDTTFNLFGIQMTLESYTDCRDPQNILTYSKEIGSDTWNKKVNFDQTMGFDFETLLKSRSAKKGTTDQKDVLAYQMEFTKEELEEWLKKISSSMDAASMDAFTVREGATVDIEIDSKSNYITKVTLDLTNTLKVEQEGAELTSCKMELNFSEFNEVGDITIDPKIIANAIDEETQQIMEYAEDYIDEIEWEIMLEEEITSYTNTDLEYDGPKPEKVDVSIVDGEVTEGIIVINGYTMEIKDGKVGIPSKKGN